MLRSNDTRRDTAGLLQHRALALSTLLATLSLAGCVRETVSCADEPSALCPDAGARMDTGPRADAFTPDVAGDAPGLDVNLPDVWEPDAWTRDDAWAPDAGFDGGPCSRCPAERPACRMDGCVQCTDDSHCVGHPSGPACDTTTNLCVGCVDPTLHCSSTLRACVSNVCLGCDGREDCGAPTPACVSNSCVQCETRSDCSAPSPACVGNTCRQCDANTDCVMASASRCDTSASTCGACMGDGDCSHIAGTPVCDEGRGLCVACTGDTEAARCGANSCNRSAGTCTTTARGSRDVCDGCVADSECVSGQRCVRHVFSGMDLGGFCFLDSAGGCGDTLPARRPYSAPTALTSIDGVSATYCMPPTATTCDGINDTRSVTCMVDSDCGAPGADDGYCPVSGGLCTYRCTGAVDCDSLLMCAGSPRHCRP